MSFATEVFAPLLQFLTAQSAAGAREAWPKGPTTPYRNAPGVPVARYAGWLQRLENSPALATETPIQICQRLRRLYYSSFTETWKPQTSKLFDKLIAAQTTYTDPPLTTDHVDSATLDGLFSTSVITTARGDLVDVSHIWAAVDLALSGQTAYARTGQAVVDSEYEALFTWSGDLGSAANLWSKEVIEQSIPDNQRQQHLIDLTQVKASLSQMLGNMDAVVLARYWKNEFGGYLNTNPLVISTEFLSYYADDAMPQAQAKNLMNPNSARRFHHFLKVCDPSLGADVRTSMPLEVMIDEQAVAGKLKDIINDAADDLLSGGSLLGVPLSSSDFIDRAGRVHYERFCLNFAKFLKEGLASGMAPWPPNPW